MLVTQRDIEAGDELLIEYGKGWWDKMKKKTEQ